MAAKRSGRLTLGFGEVLGRCTLQALVLGGEFFDAVLVGGKLAGGIGGGGFGGLEFGGAAF